MMTEMALRDISDRILHSLREYRRVVIISKKPTIEEISNISKITGLGILLIGALGFTMQLIFKLILGI